MPPRRAVLEAEVADVTARPDLDDAVVRLSGPIAFDDVIAAYVDNAEAEAAVLPAMEAVDEADLGDEDAEFVVGDAQDHDLAWYGPQELPFLLELLDDRPGTNSPPNLSGFVRDTLVWRLNSHSRRLL